MKQMTVTVPDVILIAGTRVALGIGVGLLISTKLREEARRAAGVALLAVGVLTTLPLALKLRSASPGDAERREAGAWEQRPTPAATEIHSPA
jgi:hypothetical protein